MPTSFPTSLDALANPASTDNLNTAGVVHNEQHANANDAIEALQTKVGIDGSGVTTSLDYYVKQRAALKDAANTFTPAQTFSAGILTNLGAVGTPSHSFTGDLNTGMWSPAADTLAFSTAGIERMRFTSAGYLAVNLTAPVSRLHIQGTDTLGATPIFEAISTSTDEVQCNIWKARGTPGSKAVVISGDPLGFVQWAGYDGAAYVACARVAAAVDGTPGTNDMPGRLVFSTTPDGSAALAERMRITNAGNIVLSPAALATTATDGFTYIPTCAGTPTGTPTIQTGTVPMVYDTTNDKLYVYRGGWKSVTLA